MQVERDSEAPQGESEFSGERVRNTWAICLKVGDSSAKAELIPHVISQDILAKSKMAQAIAF
jgi:hypothetical protein